MVGPIIFAIIEQQFLIISLMFSKFPKGRPDSAFWGSSFAFSLLSIGPSPFFFRGVPILALALTGFTALLKPVDGSGEGKDTPLLACFEGAL